ncbi:Acetylornithine aminotransferase [hydrothermal vent metagenome]|uniref:Acetylornithine aminotransferase n=1 Tax=hydrothermal vent metagenome TaxID=652676 RepID=A0A3B0UNV4_9ZZZZ
MSAPKTSAFEKSAMFGTYARSPLAFERGDGVRLYSNEGEEYLDFVAGIGVNALGHSDQSIKKALLEQSEKLWHVSNIYSIPQAEKLAQKLVEATFADAVFFTNSGAEAVECAIKTARHYFFDLGRPEKFEIIAFTGSFHGRTLGTIAAGGNPAYVEGFGPTLPGFTHLAPGDLKAVESAIGEATCAILIEPVQGEGGLTAMDKGFMSGLRKLCDRHDLLLILDEVQCGYGRTGKFFAYEWSSIEPDIMAIAKGIGAGFPLGACLATKKVAASMVPGTHGSTYGGNPLACAVGNAVIDRILEDGFLAHVEKMGQVLNRHMQQLMQKYPDLVIDVRGKGLMAGMKIKPPIRDFVESLRSHKLLCAAAGDNVLRFLPPLIINEDDIEEAFEKISAALEEYQSEAH